MRAVRDLGTSQGLATKVWAFESEIGQFCRENEAQLIALMM